MFIDALEISRYQVTLADRLRASEKFADRFVDKRNFAVLKYDKKSKETEKILALSGSGGRML